MSSATGCRRHERDGARPARLRREPAGPALARRQARRAQPRPELRGGRREHAARGRSRLGGVPPRGDRRAGHGRQAQPQHGVDVRVREQGGVLAGPPSRDLVRDAAHRLRGGQGARAEPRRGAGDGRRGVGGREPRVALDRLRRALRGRGAGAPRAARSPRSRACAGVRPVGWYTGRGTEATRRLVVEEGGFLYDSDAYADELPYWVEVVRTAAPRRPVHARRERLQVPAPERVRHGRRLRDVPDRLARRARGGGRPDAVRRASTAGSSVAPGRTPGLRRFLEHVAARDDVWVATRADIARHWRAEHPPRRDVRRGAR